MLENFSMGLDKILKKKLDEINEKICSKQPLNEDDMACLFFIGLFHEKTLESNRGP